jgi:hypothetical protein
MKPSPGLRASTGRTKARQPKDGPIPIGEVAKFVELVNVAASYYY